MTDLARVDVRTVAGHVRVVCEQRSEVRASVRRDLRATFTRCDNVGRRTVLPGDAEAERLWNTRCQRCILGG